MISVKIVVFILTTVGIVLIIIVVQYKNRQSRTDYNWSWKVLMRKAAYMIPIMNIAVFNENHNTLRESYEEGEIQGTMKHLTLTSRN